LSGPRGPRDPGEWPYEPWPEHDPEAPEQIENLDDEGAADAETAEADSADAPETAETADAAELAGPSPETSEGEPARPEAAQNGWDPRQLGERRRPTTAEQAVPWLVGAVLALAGIVIVLLALIFSDANGGFASGTLQPTPLALPSGSTATTPRSSASPSPKPSPSVSPSATPTKPPTYGSLEMLYLTRPSAVSASELIRDDFATPAAGAVVARSSNDVTYYAVAPDGTVAVAIMNGRLLGVARGRPSRALATAANTATFGADAATVYAVRLTRGSTNDRAIVTTISYASGRTTSLTTISYRHPANPQLTGLTAARFLDEGGLARIYPTSDGNLVLWIANAGQWRIDPVNGSVVAASRAPVLWSPDGSHRIRLNENGGVTTLSELDQTGRMVSRTTVRGLISRLRWSPRGNRVSFTLGITLSGGGVRQDLYTWDLVNGRPPVALTANGASFGGEWLGSAQFWQP
jgi:hypothetical protein